MYFDQIAFGNRLKELRAMSGLSQEQLAEELGFSTTHYRHVEHGDKGCSVDLLLALAEVFHVSTDYLLGRTPADDVAIKLQLQDAIVSLNQLLRSM